MDKTIQKLLKYLKNSESSTSIIFGAIVVIVVGILIANFVKSNKAPKLSEEGQATESAAIASVASNGFTQPAKLPTSHTVQRGDHLWGIAEKYYGSGYNYVDIAKVNKGSDKLRAGMVLTIPDVTAKKMTVKTSAQASLTAAKNEPVAQPVSITGNAYTVVKGDSLWNISVRAYGDGYKWTEVWKANKATVKNPGMINVGWQLSLPR